MLTLALTALLGGAPPPPDTTLVVSVVRFHRADASQTQVAAFIEAPGVPGSTLAVRVTDAYGTTLWDQRWPRSGRTGDQSGDVEHLRFTVGPGAHELRVAVQDSLGRKISTTTAHFEGYRAPPGASDLLLAPMIRSGVLPDSMPRAEEFRRGDLLITASARARVNVEAPDLYYLLEAYNGVGGPGTLAITIEDEGGMLVREAPPATVLVPKPVAVLTGQLDLSSLPAGRYLLRVRLVVDGRLLERVAGFERQM
ncbi:MAG: hypothetical protein ABR551_06605 [Gemmatimonadales bacterium]